MYRVQRTCNKCISGTRSRNCVCVVPELGPQIRWSRDEPWAGALRSMGGPLGEFGKKLKHTQREGLYCPGLGVGSRSKRVIELDRSQFWCRDQDQWRS